jgi:hypothetical protein
LSVAQSVIAFIGHHDPITCPGVFHSSREPTIRALREQALACKRSQNPNTWAVRSPV